MKLHGVCDNSSSEDDYELAGAVGFFDADQFEPKEREPATGAMGFFACLDEEGEKMLGMHKNKFSHNGKVDGAIDMDEVLSNLRSCGTMVEVFVLPNNDLRSNHMIVLADAMVRLHHLRVLDISGNPIGPKGVSTLLESCRVCERLQVLNLASTGLEHVPENSSIGSRIFEEFPIIADVDVSNNNLPAFFIRDIAALAGEHGAMKILKLNGNGVAGQLAVDVVKLISVSTTMTELRLGDQVVKEADKKKIFKTIRSSSSSAVGDTLGSAMCSCVCLLDVTIDSSVSNQEKTRIFSVLVQNKETFQKTEMGSPVRMSLSGRGLPSVPPMVFGFLALRELDLSSNELVALSDAVSELKKLEVLDLSENKISTIALPLHIIDMDSLKQVNLEGNPCVSDFPKHVNSGEYSMMKPYFKSLKMLKDVETQIAVLITSLDDNLSDCQSIVSELEKFSRQNDVVMKTEEKLEGRKPSGGSLEMVSVGYKLKLVKGDTAFGKSMLAKFVGEPTEPLVPKLSLKSKRKSMDFSAMQQIRKKSSDHGRQTEQAPMKEGRSISLTSPKKKKDEQTQSRLSSPPLSPTTKASPDRREESGGSSTGPSTSASTTSSSRRVSSPIGSAVASPVSSPPLSPVSKRKSSKIKLPNLSKSPMSSPEYSPASSPRQISPGRHRSPRSPRSPKIVKSNKSESDPGLSSGSPRSASPRSSFFRTSEDGDERHRIPSSHSPPKKSESGAFSETDDESIQRKRSVTFHPAPVAQLKSPETQTKMFQKKDISHPHAMRRGSSGSLQTAEEFARLNGGSEFGVSVKDLSALSRSDALEKVSLTPKLRSKKDKKQRADSGHASNERKIASIGSSWSNVRKNSPGRSESSVLRTTTVLWGLMRTCTFPQIPVYGFFHQVSMIALRTSQKDWESCLIDALEVLNQGDCHVILLVMNAGSLQPDARVSLLSMLNRRFRKYGIHEVILFVQDNDVRMVFDILRSHINNVAKKVGYIQSRGFPATAWSLYEKARKTPVIGVSAQMVTKIDSSPISEALNNSGSISGDFSSLIASSELLSFDEAVDAKVVEWAQAGGLLSRAFVGEACISLEWAKECLSWVEKANVFLFESDNLRKIFPAHLYNFEARSAAMRFLEAAGIVARVGFKGNQWVVTRRRMEASPHFDVTKSVKPNLDAAVDIVKCKRLFVVSPPIKRVQSLMAKIYLQMAGILTGFEEASMFGFKGFVEMGEKLYNVEVHVKDCVDETTFVVSVETDKKGLLLFMASTVVERTLEETNISFSRRFLGKSGTQEDLDKFIYSLFGEEKTEGKAYQLANSVSESVKPFIPEVLYLDTMSVAWQELKMEKVIGTGSFGEIFRASYAGKTVAVKKIKVVREDETGQFESLRETFRELWVLSLIKHRNIVRLVGACFSPLAIVIEFLELGDLRNYLDGKPDMPWATCHSLMFDIATAMDYAHSQKPPLIHSDLKSPNVLLQLHKGKLECKVADLGLASFSFNSVTKVDNPMWAAPELISKAKICSPMVDVYSFALISYEMFTGIFPFHVELEELGGNFFAKLGEMICSGTRPTEEPIHQGIPEEARKLMRDCWSQEPSKRPGFRAILGTLLGLKHSQPRGGGEKSLANSISNMQLLAPPSLKQYVTSPTPSESKAFALLGNVLVVLLANGYICVYDSATLVLQKTLRWKLAERIRVASAVVSNEEIWFVYGGNMMVTLNKSMELKRIQGELLSFDFAHMVEHSIWVVGRNQDGMAAQIWKDGKCVEKAIALGSSKRVFAMTHAKGKKWDYVFCGEMAKRDRSGVIVIDRKTNEVLKRLKTDRLVSLKCFKDKVWLFSHSNGVSAIDCETLSNVKQISGQELFAPCLINRKRFVFGVCKNRTQIWSNEGKIIFEDSEDAVKTVDANSMTLQTEDLIIVLTSDKILSWRFV